MLKDKSIVSSYRMPPELHRFFKDFSERNGITRNNLVNKFVAWLRDNPSGVPVLEDIERSVDDE